MIFGFACFIRGCPNNPALFYALKALSAEGIKVDSIDYFFIKTKNPVTIESIIMTLDSFNIRPIRLSKDAPEVLSTENSTMYQRRTFFRQIKFNRLRYHRGMDTTYWHWNHPPLDTLGNPLPPPAGSYETDTTTASRWREYWDKCPGGEHCTMAILD